MLSIWVLPVIREPVICRALRQGHLGKGWGRCSLAGELIRYLEPCWTSEFSLTSALRDNDGQERTVSRPLLSLGVCAVDVVEGFATASPFQRRTMIILFVEHPQLSMH